MEDRAMTTVRDEDLILYYYRDGLEPAQLSKIEAKLDADPALKGRYDALRRDLQAASAAFKDEAPQPGFEARLWRDFDRRVSAHRSRPRRQRSMAYAAGIALLALGIGWGLGRLTAPAPDTAPLLAPRGGARVFGAALVRHLESTERALRVATVTPDDPELIRELADALLREHRLYAAAATRARRPDLAAFLGRLEPILLRLAHSETLEGPDGVRKTIVDGDLPFQIRAVTAMARRDLDRAGAKSAVKPRTNWR